MKNAYVQFKLFQDTAGTSTHMRRSSWPPRNTPRPRPLPTSRPRRRLPGRSGASSALAPRTLATTTTPVTSSRRGPSLCTSTQRYPTWKPTPCATWVCLERSNLPFFVLSYWSTIKEENKWIEKEKKKRIRLFNIAHVICFEVRPSYTTYRWRDCLYKKLIEYSYERFFLKNT